MQKQITQFSKENECSQIYKKSVEQNKCKNGADNLRQSSKSFPNPWKKRMFKVPIILWAGI